jgi:hypothetical protein
MESTSMRKAANLRDITMLLHSLEQQMEQRQVVVLLFSYIKNVALQLNS